MRELRPPPRAPAARGREAGPCSSMLQRTAVACTVAHIARASAVADLSNLQASDQLGPLICCAQFPNAGFEPMEVSEEDKGTCNLNSEPGL